ncbi:MAG TPA: hypothetical protein VG298_05180 [Acidimicrobiales bacterium]|nr:hypothetical protein [Acidimicrobiales bacterium]
MSSTTTGQREAVLEFLRQHDAERTPHLFGDLLSHLLGVEELVHRWGGSDRLGLVALAHATYGTHGFEPHLLELADRPVLATIIGPEAEAEVYFYASCDRDLFYPQLEGPETRLGDLRFRDRFTGGDLAPSAQDVTRFVDLTYANEAELAAASPGGPAEWTWEADFCRRTRRWSSPGFFEGASALLQMED